MNFYNKGIDKFEKVKNISSLTSTQQNPIENAFKTKTPVIDKRKLADFISMVEYNNFFDFETFTDAVPVLRNKDLICRCLFSFQCTYNLSRDEILKIDDPHPEFIADHLVDPRRQIAESLISNFPSSGTIMAYNESFEKVHKTLAEYCPDLKDDH